MKLPFDLNYFFDLSYDVGGFMFGCNLMFDESIQNIFDTAFGIFSEMSTGEVGSFTTNYKRHKMIQRSSHSLQGLSLLRNCLDELPQDRKATIAGDMGELKRELREKVILLLVLEMMIFMTMRRWKIA